MSPKVRTKDKHLPSRVYRKHGGFYYVDKAQKWHKLGSNFGEAMTAWAKLIEKPERINTMNQLFDRYMLEIAPLKTKKSYKNNQYQMVALRVFFGNMSPEDVTPVIIYEYLDIRSLKAKVGANREKSLLSHCFTIAIRWGLVRDNPCRLVKRVTERPRKRYIEDWEFAAVKSVASEMIKCAMDLAYLSGQRIGDILKIKLSDLTEDGIKIEQGKTGSKIIIQWSDELRKSINNIRQLVRPVRGLSLFCNQKGHAYTVDGFSTMWQRTVKKALAAGLITESFTFHDIRAKTRSDAENGLNASELLGHSDPRITERVYNRKHKKVNPIR